MAKKTTKRLGRPKKPADKRAVERIPFAATSDEVQTINDAIRLLNKETADRPIGEMIDPNRQLVLRLLLRKLKKQLQRKGFSMLEEYLLDSNK